MFNSIKKAFFPTLIAITALSVSASAAFYSVTGLSKLFAGASFEVMVMAGSLEVAKLIIASLLHKYWKSISTLLKVYLSSALVVLVVITSMGIYGFLSSAYQETANLSQNIDSRVKLIETKRDNLNQQLLTYNSEKESINQAITSLRSGLANNVIEYKDTETGKIIRSTSSSTRRALEKQLDKAIDRQSVINSKVDELNQKVFDYETEIVEVQTSSEVAGELGPLKYISGLTGTPMDKIINWLLLVIIFVFDPLAIALVIAANFAFAKAFPPKRENLYGEKVEDSLEDELSVWDKTLQDGLDDLDGDEDEDEYPEPNEALKQAADKHKEKAKVVNSTTREVELLYPNGMKRWVKKKDVDPNKIQYL